MALIAALVTGGAAGGPPFALAADGVAADADAAALAAGAAAAAAGGLWSVSPSARASPSVVRRRLVAILAL